MIKVKDLEMEFLGIPAWPKLFWLLKSRKLFLAAVRERERCDYRIRIKVRQCSMLSVFKEGGRGPCDEACRWLQDAEKGKEMNYFIVSPQRTQPHCHFDFSLYFRLQAAFMTERLPGKFKSSERRGLSWVQTFGACLYKLAAVENKPNKQNFRGSAISLALGF